jgi:hypothetical protein
MPWGAAMQGLLILGVIIAAIVFLMPVIVGVLAFLICTAAIMLLLARFGFLTGAMFKRYGFGADDRSWSSPGRKRRFHFEEEERDWRESQNGWHRSEQEGEEIVLPETALKKENPGEERE